MRMDKGYGDPAIVDVSPPEARSLYNTIADLLHVQPHTTHISKFKDGETDITIEESVRGRDVYVFQAYIPPIGERLYELKMAVSAVNSGGGARRLTAVWPYCFGMRGERQTAARQSVPIEVVVRDLYSIGVRNLITVCLHTDVIQTIFRTTGERRGIKVEHLPFESLAAHYIIRSAEENGYNRVVVASPDVGGAKRADAVRKIIRAVNPSIDVEFAICYKDRIGADKVKISRMIGDVKGLPVYFYDDIADTVGSTDGAAEVAEKEGAAAIYFCLTHPVLGEGYEHNMKKLCERESAKEVVFSNSIPLKQSAAENPKVRIIRLEPLIAAAILRMNEDRSLSELHKYETVIPIYKKRPVVNEEKDIIVGFSTHRRQN